MKDIAKMIRFDFVTSKSLSFNGTLGLIAVTFLLSLLGSPAGAICLFAPLMIFAPVSAVATRDFKLIYGILPVRKSAVTRAAFIEIISTLIIGEALALAFFGISRITVLKDILPESITNVLGANVEGEFVMMIPALIVIVFVCLSVIGAYLQMIMSVKGQEHITLHALLAILIPAIALIAAVVLDIDVMGLIVKRAGSPAVTAALNISAIAVNAVFCELSVRKLADKEM